MNNESISVVIPYYRCEKSLWELYARLRTTLEEISGSFEIILVNDASPDNGWEVIRGISEKDRRVRGINLARNFGQHYAITAGLERASGDWVVVMDCDLQDRPEEIATLYARAQEGYDVVFARRVKRRDHLLKRLSSRLFYIVYNYFTETRFDNTIANFSISRSRVIRELLRMREQNRSFPLFVHWVGFRTGYVEVQHSRRPEGKTSYTLRKLLKLSTDSIVAQSNKPLRLAIAFGFCLSSVSLLYAFYLVFKYFYFGIPVQGWTSVMVSIWFVGGLLFANMGVMGLYIGKIFDETKARPLYIVRETTGWNNEDNR